MKQLLLTFLYLLAVFTTHARQYDLTAKQITTVNGLPTNIVSQIWQTNDGFMWFETRSGLCRYDGYSIQLFDSDATTIPSKESNLKTVEAEWQRDGQGKMTRIGKNGSRQTWQLIPKEVINYTRNDHFHVADVDERTEAISTYGAGLYLYDKPTGELTCIDIEVINTPYLTGLFVDRTGCIWVVEDYLGVICLQLKKLQYQHRLIKQSRIQDANHIRCMAELGNENILCSNQMGELFVYNPKREQVSYLKSMESKVYAALTDTQGNLWIGTRGDGLFKNDQKVEGLPSADVYYLAEDKNYGLWIAMLGGGVAHLYPDGSIETFLKDKNCHDIRREKDDCWWVAAEDSLYRLKKENGQWKEESVMPGYFVCLCIASDGTVWAGGIGCGLVNARYLQSYTIKNGMANDNVYAIVEDHQHRIWMGTEEGLSCLTPKTNDIQNHRISESQLANVFNERTALCLPDGRLLFGSHNGIVEIEDSILNIENSPIKTLVTELLVNGERESFDKRLSYTENNLMFRFSNFQYAMLQSVLYQYRLDGIDKDWCKPTKDNVAIYRNLPPGQYTFRVRSNNGLGVWGEETAISIIIHQPWWNTWWAWLLYALTACIIAYISIIVVRRIMRLHRQVEVERQVSAFKTDFYNRIERELRNPVNVLRGAAENVQLSGTSKTTVQSLRRGSQRMLKLMDMIQQFHRLNDVEMQVKAEQDAMNEEAELHFRTIQQTIHAGEQEFRELAPPPINEQTILVVEDDEDSLTHLTDTLNPYFRIVSCQSMSECIKALEEQRPSALLVDITADEKEYIELTKRLHKEHTTLPVIHLSSFSDDARQLRSLRAGAADYITKPFSGRVLVERVRKTIKQTPSPLTTYPSPLILHPSPLTDVKDKKFLDRFHAILSQHITDENFSVEQFAELMHLGRTQFYKRVKELTGESPVQHLHRARLDYAAHLLRESRMTVEEVMTHAGFSSPTHFYSSFRKQFGMSPKELRQTGRRED